MTHPSPRNSNRAKQGIHVLSGLHSGAICALANGPTVLGSAPHCDVVLTDAGIYAEHLLLVTSPNGVQAHPLSSIGIDNQRIDAGRKHDLIPGAIVEIGPIAIGIGPLDHSFSDPSDDDAQMPVVPVGSTKRAWSAGLKFKIAAATLGAALLAFVIGQLSFQAPANAIAQADPGQDLQRVSAAIASLNEPELAVQAKPNGQIAITGYISNLSAMQRMRNAIAGERVALSVYSADELSRFARELLASRGLIASVSYAGNGKLKVTGQDDQQGSLRTALKQIRKELPGLNKLEHDLRMPPMQARQVQQPKANEPFVLNGTDGINSGHETPYISAGKNYIFPGGVLNNGMSVKTIEPDRVLLKDQKKNTTTEVLVQ